jgi:hypothetical protein
VLCLSPLGEYNVIRPRPLPSECFPNEPEAVSQSPLTQRRVAPWFEPGRWPPLLTAAPSLSTRRHLSTLSRCSETQQAGGRLHSKEPEGGAARQGEARLLLLKGPGPRSSGRQPVSRPGIEHSATAGHSVREGQQPRSVRWFTLILGAPTSGAAVTNQGKAPQQRLLFVLWYSGSRHRAASYLQKRRFGERRARLHGATIQELATWLLMHTHTLSGPCQAELASFRFGSLELLASSPGALSRAGHCRRGLDCTLRRSPQLQHT